jgi:MYXO-CTERM domain-containing protein
MLLRSFIALLTAFAASSALAHGPQIQLTVDAGKITTRRLVQEEPYNASLTPATSVYVMPLKESAGVWYTRPNGSLTAGGLPQYYSGPGFTYGYGFAAANPAASFETGSKFGLAFTAGVKRWSGGAFVDAGDTQIEAFLGSFAAPTATAKTTDAAPFGSLAVPAGSGIEITNSNAHSTVRYRLLGDGLSPTTASADGVYLVSLQVSSTQAGLAPSDPFHFVLSKNASVGEVQAAMAALGVAPALIQVVPEPTCGALGAAVLVMLNARRRRRSTRRS